VSKYVRFMPDAKKPGSHGFAALSHHPTEVSVVMGPDEFEKRSFAGRIR
jgi:hypothetical protein